jgi:hypothetical protein
VPVICARPERPITVAALAAQRAALAAVTAEQHAAPVHAVNAGRVIVAALLTGALSMAMAFTPCLDCRCDRDVVDMAPVPHVHVGGVAVPTHVDELLTLVAPYADTGEQLDATALPAIDPRPEPVLTRVDFLPTIGPCATGALRERVLDLLCEYADVFGAVPMAPPTAYRPAVDVPPDARAVDVGDGP